jgi:protein disulfide-isomerase A1
MKAILIAVLCIAAVFAGEYATEEGVLVLTDSTFAQAIEEYDFVLAEFYAPWCGHCKSLAPEYVKAAAQLAESNPNVKLAKIDCTVEKELASKYEIKGFPTLKFFSKAAGAPIPYEAGRTAPDIVNWLKKKTGPVSVELKTVEETETLIGNSDVVAIFFGPSGTEEYNNFIKVANTYEDVAFANSGEQTVAEKYEAQINSIVLFKKFDEPKVVHSGATDVESIKAFINEHKDPSVFNFDQKTAQKIFGEGKDALFLIVSDNEAGAKAQEAVRGVAKELKGKLALSIAKIEDNFGSRLAEYIGVTKEHLPAIRLVRPSKNNLKYLFEHDISIETIRSFFSDFVENKLKPFFKSEKLPEPDHEENVKIVVGKNFDSVVINNDKNVLVEYYAPWCGHCKTLAPIYAALATKLKDNSEIVLAKMDATANEVESVSVQGFPTIKFYPKGNKQAPLDFNGERTEEGFIKYLKEQGVNLEETKEVKLDEL